MSDNYTIPAALVNKLIAAILISLISISGYMLVWAVNDSAWHAREQQRVDTLVKHVDRLEEKL